MLRAAVFVISEVAFYLVVPAVDVGGGDEEDAAA